MSDSPASYRTAAYSPDDVIVDLSPYANALLNYEDISHLLDEQSEHKLVDYIRALAKMSYSQISLRYEHWRQADAAHDVYVDPSATRFREKAVIADTRAISDTVVTYLMAALAGRNPMFMLEGQNRKSRQVAAVLERILHQHMRRTAGEARLAQLLLDSVRYGFAPTKVVWDANTNSNQIINFDPRRVFPDPRIQWGDWDRMQYIIFSDFFSYDALVQTGLYPKLKMFPALRKMVGGRRGWEIHGFHKDRGRALSIDPTTATEGSGGNYYQIGEARAVDECWIRLCGYQVNLPGVDQIWLVVTIVDEGVVIRMQLNPYGRQFPVVIGGLYNDAHKTYSQSLYDIMLPLHDIATWLLRSRIDNVQASLNNLIFADPTQVNIPDLIDRNPWGVVRTLPGSKPGDGVFIAEVPDVTANHWRDIAALSDLKQRLSAASDAQQGVPTSDVRTATEIQRLTQLGSQRLGVLARIQSAMTIRPMVSMMVANIQDAIAYNGSIRVDPFTMPSHLSPMVQDGYIDFKIEDLQGDVDYLVVDGTLPIEPSRNAEAWLQTIQIVHNTGLNMEYKVGKLAEEAIRALGITDLDQFRISPEERQQGMSPSQQLALMEKMRGASVLPQDEVDREVGKGNLIPIRSAA